MELVHFHVRHTAARPPCHRYAVPRRSTRRGGKDIGAPRSAGREYGRPPYISVDMVGGLVEGIDAPDMPVAGIFLTMTAGDEVNGHHVRHQRDIGVALRRARQSLLHRCARGVVHMNEDRKSTRLNSSHYCAPRMPSS